MVGGSPGLDMAGCRQGWEPDIPRKLLCGSYKGRDDYGCRAGYAFGTDWNTGFRVGQEEGRGMFDSPWQKARTFQTNSTYRGPTLPGQMSESRWSLCDESGTSSLSLNFGTPVLAFCFGDWGRHACVGVDIIVSAWWLHLAGGCTAFRDPALF